MAKRVIGIGETVLEELLQNALVHLDLLKTAAIRLLIAHHSPLTVMLPT